MPDPQDPFAYLDNAPTQTAPPPQQQGGGPQDPFAYLDKGTTPTPSQGMAPTVSAPQEQGQPIFGLPQEIGTPFGSFNPTDIPLAGFFLNQRTYQPPSHQEVAQTYQPTQAKDITTNLGVTVPSTTPVVGGLLESVAEANRPTTPDMASAGIRDLPVIGGLSRAAEGTLNLLNQSWKTVAEPAAGLASLPIRSALGGDTGALARAEQRAGVTLSQGPGAWQEIGRAALAETPAAYKFVAPMVFDPLTYVGGAFSKAQEAQLTARSVTDVADISKMSAIDRISRTGMLRAPVSAEEIRAAGEMGVLSKEALGMVPNKLLQEVIPWGYTNKSKVMELFENSISGLLAKSQFVDAAGTHDLLGAISNAAKTNSFRDMTTTFPDMVKAFRSYEGQRLIRTLGEVDLPRSKAVLDYIPQAIKEVQLGQLAEKSPQWVKDVFEAFQAGKIDATQGVEKVINDAAKYKMLADATDTIGEASRKAFNLTKDERLAVKIRDTVKNLEANLFIGFSPTTVINNWGNNTVTQVLHGLNPMGVSKYADNMWKAWKMNPDAEFRLIQENALKKLGMSVRGAGFAGPVKGKVFGPFLKLYSVMEDGARRNIWAKGAEDAFKKAMTLSANSMPDDVAMALRAVDPSGALLDTVKGAIRSSFTPDEILQFVQGKLPVTLESNMGSIAKAMGISEDALSTFMHQSEVWPDINKALAESKNAAEFEGKATTILNDLAEKIKRARTLQDQTGKEFGNFVKTLNSPADVKAATMPFDQWVFPPERARIWFSVTHPVKASDFNKWVADGSLKQKIIDSVAHARARGDVAPDALAELWQKQANAAFQLLDSPSIPDSTKALYEEHLKLADNLLRVMNGKGLNFDELSAGEMLPELGKKTSYNPQGRMNAYAQQYVQEFKRGAGQAIPERPATRPATVPTTPTGAGGAVSPAPGAEVPPPTRPSGTAGSPINAPTTPDIARPATVPTQPVVPPPTTPTAGAVGQGVLPGFPEQAYQRNVPPEALQFNVGAPPTIPTTPEFGNAIKNLQDVAKERPGASGMAVDEAVAAQYKVVADVLQQLQPNLQKLYDTASALDQSTPQTAAARAALEAWVRGDLTAAMTDARTVAARIGDWYVQRNILNYSARTNLDDWLSWAFPFAYWPRATATNYLMEALNRPMLITSYVRAKQALDNIQNDEKFPARFKGSIPVPMPFASLAPWLTGKLFFDPLKDWLPVDRFTTEPLKNLGYLQPNTTDIAAEIRNQMSGGAISQADGEAALKQMKGNKIWDAIESQMRQSQQPDPLDVGSLIFSPHFPLDWANKVMQGRPQDISYLVPLSRQIKGGTQILEQAFPQLAKTGLAQALAGPEGPTGGIDPEGAIRQKLGLPPGDSTVSYRIDRMLASMSVDGSTSPNDARLAMIERKGPVYDEAVRRAGIETGIGSISGLIFFNARVMAGGEQIAMNDARDVSQLVDTLSAQAGLNPITASYDEKKQALKDTKGADGKPLWDQVSQWYTDHPEYKPRMNLFDTVESRLNQWLSDSIWNQYMGMSALDRRMFSDANPDFKTQFAAKPTRQPAANLPNSLLEKWNALLGGYNPQAVVDNANQPTPLNITNIDQLLALLKQGGTPEQYKPQDPKLAAAYQKWLDQLSKVQDTPEYQQYQTRLNAISDFQTQYYATTDKNERKQIVAQHPELQDYWTWSRDFKANNPVVKDFFAFDAQFWKDNPELAKLLGRSPTTSTSSYAPYQAASYGAPRAPYTPYARRASTGSSGSANTVAKQSAAWDSFAASMESTAPDILGLLEQWLQASPGDGATIASSNNRLAAWLAAQSPAFLANLRLYYASWLKSRPKYGNYGTTRHINVKTVAAPKTYKQTP